MTNWETSCAVTTYELVDTIWRKFPATDDLLPSDAAFSELHWQILETPLATFHIFQQWYTSFKVLSYFARQSSVLLRGFKIRKLIFQNWLLREQFPDCFSLTSLGSYWKRLHSIKTDYRASKTSSRRLDNTGMDETTISLLSLLFQGTVEITLKRGHLVWLLDGNYITASFSFAMILFPHNWENYVNQPKISLR